MKKTLTILLIIFMIPFSIFAYSNNIIVGGESIGIKINTDGLVVIGFYKVKGKYIAKESLKMGDIIIKINGTPINNIDNLSSLIDDNIFNKKELNLEVIRNNKVINTKLNVEEERGIYKTGIYVKDAVVGIGTLTYIDPETKIYGALGHEITLSDNRNIVEVKNGNILESKVIGIDKSKNGYVGSKNAIISYGNIIGNVIKNTKKGIYGKYESIPDKERYEISKFEDIELKDAYILTVTSNNKIEKYKIRITNKYSNKKNTQKAFSFEIVDKKLLSKTGGIIQGMSGSPIIQNNKLIGAVTNVVVDNVKEGYGISIITMLEEGEK